MELVTVYSIFVWLSAILIASRLDVIILLGSRSLSSRVFVFGSFTTAVWSAAQGFFIIAFGTPEIPLFIVKLQHFLGIIISLGFFYFSLVYPDDRIPAGNIFIVLGMSFLGGIFFFLLFFTDSIISSVFPVGGVQLWGWRFGQLLPLFHIVFFGLWIALVTNVHRKESRTIDKVTRRNMRYMFWGLTTGIIPPSILNIVLPGIGYFQANWFGPIASTIWIYIVGYSIIKYRQLNVRAFTAEVLAMILSILMFINIFTNTPFGVYGRGILFGAFLILVYFLVKNILTVSLQKETLSALTVNLQHKVGEQTKELQRAYEVEKQARIELEKLNQNKNDFIIITQHHLRMPLAQIRWYADSVAKGLYGNVSSAFREAIERIDRAAWQLIRTLNNFLAINEMKIGTRVLHTETVSLMGIFESAVRECSEEIEKRRRP